MLTALDDLFQGSTTALLTIYLAIAGVAAAAVIFVLRGLVRVYLEYRAPRVVICPENEQYAAVRMNAAHAAVTSLFGEPDLRLQHCSRWPDRTFCKEDCLAEIDFSPIGCPARDLLGYWYHGNECAFCRRTLGKLRWFDRPALLSPEGTVVESTEVPPEAIPDILATHKPVCHSCKARRKLPQEQSDLMV